MKDTDTVAQIKEAWKHRDLSHEASINWELLKQENPILQNALEFLDIQHNSHGHYINPHHSPLAELMGYMAGHLRECAKSECEILATLAKDLIDYKGIKFDPVNQEFYDDGTMHHNRALRNFLSALDDWDFSIYEWSISDESWNGDLENYGIERLAEMYD